MARQTRQRAVVLSFEHVLTVGMPSGGDKALNLAASARAGDIAWIGDAQRIDDVRNFFRSLEQAGVAVILVSEQCLESIILAVLRFLELMGCVSCILDSRACGVGSGGGGGGCGGGSAAAAKQKLVAQLIEQHAMTAEDIVLLDHDTEWLRSSGCRIVHVRGGRGMGQQEMQKALLLLGLIEDH